MSKLLSQLRPAALVLLATAVPLLAHAQTATPATPAATAPTSVIKAYDARAEALLQRAQDSMKAASSLSGQVELIYPELSEQGSTGTKVKRVTIFRTQKPDLMHNDITIEKQGVDGKWTLANTYQYVRNGKKLVQVSPTSKSYWVIPDVQSDSGIITNIVTAGFSDPRYSVANIARGTKKAGSLLSLTTVPDVVHGGVLCSVAQVKARMGADGKSSGVVSIRFYVGKKDGILRGTHMEIPSPRNDGTRLSFDETVTNVVIGSTLPASTFATNLKGYKEEVTPTLLAAGTIAPDFTAYDKDGKPLKLSDFRGKIVVLDFWATWCGPCIASLPHTTEVAKKTADKGVVVLALNVWDKKDEFDKWLPLHPEYAALTFAIDPTSVEDEGVARKLYKVSGIPTQYVIDRDGKIVTSFVGFGGPTDDLQKAIAKADNAATTASTGTQK